MRWTRAARLTNRADADGEVVWSGRLDAGVKLAETISADDGDKQARSPGRARRKPLKPLRAGMPGFSGGPVVTTLVHNSGASRREVADSHLKLSWLFEN